jgi:hypothetical protein
MQLSNFLSWLNPKRARADRARAELKANAEKALRMKQQADSEARIPPHQTAHEGMRPGAAAIDANDASRGREAGFTPQLKRSKVARSGDAS